MSTAPKFRYLECDTSTVLPNDILITGGAGFNGGHTVLAFIDRGEVPIVLDHLSTGNRAAVPPGVPFSLPATSEIRSYYCILHKTIGLTLFYISRPK
jgi:hypothetical protein